MLGSLLPLVYFVEVHKFRRWDFLNSTLYHSTRLLSANFSHESATNVRPTHTALFFQNLFHGHIVQRYIDQMSPPKNKKCSLGKVFGINHPQTPGLLSRRGPRGLDARLSQHYISPKMTCCNFSNFCRKKFPGLTKKFLTFLYNFGGCNF